MDDLLIDDLVSCVKTYLLTMIVKLNYNYIGAY